MKINLITILAYLIGTIPFAYIFLKISSGKNILHEGSGNVGALNSYETSGKKWVGVVTLIADLLKGVAAALLANLIMPNDFTAMLAVSVAVLLGHNFNIFLKGKGGRGLSTAAGVFLVVNPLVIALWLIMFSLGLFAIKKHVHVGAITAIITAPILMWLTPPMLVDKLTLMGNFSHSEVVILSAAVCAVLMLRHIKPLSDLLKKKEA